MSDELPFRTLATVKDLETAPVALEPIEAQPWCNFVLWVPDELPTGCDLTVGTLRKDAPPGRTPDDTAGRTPWTSNNPCAYRFEVVGDGRRLRVKQFLYDWAFPALDHPCLWGNATRAVAIDGQSVVWLGTDYMQKRAASARLSRTMIELSVMEGEFTDAEIVSLYRGLRPVASEAAARISDTPFAVLSYWSRREDAEMVVVPTGLWKFHRESTKGAHEGTWTLPPRADSLLQELSLPRTLGGLAVDSAATFSGWPGARETEVLYAGGPGRGRELRLIAQSQGGGRLSVPAPEEPHPGTRVTTTVEDTDVQLAWIDERYGPFDAVLREPLTGVEAKLLSSTGVGLDRAWFEQAVGELIRSVRQQIEV